MMILIMIKIIIIIIIITDSHGSVIALDSVKDPAINTVLEKFYEKFISLA